ncbi:MAG: hypothetical protein ACLP07_07460 [Terracidiphilus sp.]
MGSSVSRILFLTLLAGGAVNASAAHLKPASVKPLDAVFQIGASGTIEASLDPPIQGVLRIVVRASPSAGRQRQGSSAGALSPQSERQNPTLEVTQWDRSIPFRLVNKSGRHHLFGGRPSSLVADIDVNDLTPGVPVRVSVHSNLPAPSDSAPPDLEARAYAVVY